VRSAACTIVTNDAPPNDVVDRAAQVTMQVTSDQTHAPVGTPGPPNSAIIGATTSETFARVPDNSVAPVLAKDTACRLRHVPVVARNVSSLYFRCLNDLREC
jgi:hypothetical protein